MRKYKNMHPDCSETLKLNCNHDTDDIANRKNSNTSRQQ